MGCGRSQAVGFPRGVVALSYVRGLRPLTVGIRRRRCMHTRKRATPSCLEVVAPTLRRFERMDEVILLKVN